MKLRRLSVFSFRKKRKKKEEEKENSLIVFLEHPQNVVHVIIHAQWETFRLQICGSLSLFA